LSYVRELVSSICAVLATEAFDVYDLGDLRDYACLLAADSPSRDRALIFDFREALNAKMCASGVIRSSSCNEFREFVKALIELHQPLNAPHQ
jgi:hypothetical protein